MTTNKTPKNINVNRTLLGLCIFWAFRSRTLTPWNASFCSLSTAVSLSAQLNAYQGQGPHTSGTDHQVHLGHVLRGGLGKVFRVPRDGLVPETPRDTGVQVHALLVVSPTVGIRTPGPFVMEMAPSRRWGGQRRPGHTP